MKSVIGITAFAAILAMSSGCDSGSGSGTRSITVGPTTVTAVYGWSGANNKLGFVIFSDLDTPDNVASASAKWAGYIESPAGLTVHYKHTAGGMDINGTEYKFAKGRVFLVSTKEGSMLVSQLDIPIRDAEYRAEINRIAEREEVQAFLHR
ncbi:hypothetical protein N9D23_15575 [Rubripirellula sp.]|jgi:hypothetical protein|nr:hypothetical protein [Rubripirellula sp.]